MPRLFAVSDLHLSHPIWRSALAGLPAVPDDRLILPGDVGDSPEQIAHGFRHLAAKFKRVIWASGKHELWSIPGTPVELRGAALYDHLVSVARSYGIVTPEDPYPVFEHETGQLVLVPMFLLYDYSFRPKQVSFDHVIAWAQARSCVCSDEILLHPDPYPSRADWYRARVETTLARLEPLDPHAETLLINHFPLEEEHAVLALAPRFTPCGMARSSRGPGTKGFAPEPSSFGICIFMARAGSTACLSRKCPSATPSQWDRKRPIGTSLLEVQLSPRQCDV
jgi:hypothetical protein